MSYPQGWKKFCSWRKEVSVELLPNHLNMSELNRFAARFRLAKSYEGLIMKDYPDASTLAYGSVFGLFLTYSAFEQLYKALGSPNRVIVREWAINDETIAKKLRKSTKILSFIEKKVDSDQLRSRIKQFNQKEHNNILVIAQAVRHLVAHGMMSIHSGNVKPNTVKNFCDLLTYAVEEKTQFCFDELVLSLCNIYLK
ncbi:hypothetical protein GM3708_1688 [Geminocystis sp. NIES-3708]|uniref:hypothetical protein n=1 Tax=Geminocystis sp. NIES-3708 TaxID=1615909 RepID=UPI0005FC9B2E|nr:hypothetical protein [Geminocystis sp. NIES-3708]BAQ61282.1 hypothetical protein GM3708_1688 [Geminocystis sp. NIES-3708]